MRQAQSGTAWDEMGDGVTERGGYWRVLVSPAVAVSSVAVLFIVAGVVVLLPIDPGEPLASTLFDGFMYVGLPAAVLLGAVSLRRSDLPPRSQWYIVSGYAAGVGFVTGLLLWSELAYLLDGGTLLALRADFVFYGNFGGILGFVAGINRARAVNDRRLRRELERQNETLDEFASAISHDLRSPLQVANGRVVLARRECDCDEHLGEVKHALDRMETLIEESLVLARQGERVVESRDVAFGPLVDSCWRSVDSGDVDLVVDADPDATIEADEVRVAQVFENLFRNAVEHGSTSPRSGTHEDAVEHGSTSPRSGTHEDAVEHGSTRPASRARQDAVEHGSTSPRSGAHEDAVAHGGEGVTVRVGLLDDGFYVEDDGPGIPPEKRADVFDAGYTTTDDGTGYGLRIVRAIVDAHSWEVEVAESAAGGARFEVTGVVVAR